ncbi:MAG: tetratricopeptide repeat protein [archaeon]
MKFVLSSFLVVLLSATAMSACSDYVSIAESRLIPPYPNYFGAAGEYVHAADCYYAEGNIGIANFYYKQAGDDYILAAGELVAGGDYYQRAKSYEMAADAYARAGLKNKATEYYSRALAEFNKHYYTQEASLVQGKIDSLAGKQSAEFIGIIGLVSLMALFVSFFALLYMFATKLEIREKLREMKASRPPSPPPIVKRSAEQFRSPIIPKREPEPRIPTAKEKMAQKLREKYMPKY